MNKLYDEDLIKNIADAIREKNGSTDTYKVGEMAAAIAALSGAERVSWHQCPEAVRNYLNNVTYDPADYSTSLITDYAPATPVKSNYKPIGITVDGKTFYNQVPGIEAPFATSNQAGTVKPLDQLRWVNTIALNARDLGGWSCDGGTVKYGLLFRGGSVTASDRSVLVDECGVRHDLDLRGQSEANLSNSPLGDDIWFTCPESYAWYSLTDKTTWYEILDCVVTAVTHNEPVYFHCAAGADRTATIACVLEALLGMSQSDIDKDYELTNFYSGTKTDATARRRDESEWKGLITAINEYTGASFRDKAVSFAKSCGISLAQINAFRQAMSTGTPEVITGTVYTVTYNLTNCASSNTATEADEGGTFLTTLSASDGYVMSDVIITMGDSDVSNAYNEEDGSVSISNVSGNIVITAVATSSISYVNQLIVTSDGLNKRISGTSVQSATGYCVTEPIVVDLSTACQTTFKNFASIWSTILSADKAYGSCKAALLNSSKEIMAAWYLASTKTNSHWLIQLEDTNAVGDLQTILDTTPTAGTKPTASEVKYVQFCLAVDPTKTITAEDLVDKEIIMPSRTISPNILV